jgi:NDP-sugar pyrophosphorylase family protein
MKIVVAMAGLGTRFQEAGHTYPKPLIRTGNTTMIQNVYYSLAWPGDWYFIALKEHLDQFNFMLPLLESMGNVTVIDKPTRGAAETLQQCKEIMNSSGPFISVNCDQVFEWDTTELQEKMKAEPDASYMTTYNSLDEQRHSFALTNDNDIDVWHCCEKTRLGYHCNNATTGFYHFANGEVYNEATTKLLSKPPEYGEYYVSSVYNELIAKKHIVKQYKVHAKTFWPVGTQPDWLHYTHRHFRR